MRREYIKELRGDGRKEAFDYVAKESIIHDSINSI